MSKGNFQQLGYFLRLSSLKFEKNYKNRPSKTKGCKTK